jgi:hypothetical protein
MRRRVPAATCRPSRGGGAGSSASGRSRAYSMAPRTMSASRSWRGCRASALRTASRVVGGLVASSSRASGARMRKGGRSASAARRQLVGALDAAELVGARALLRRRQRGEGGELLAGPLGAAGGGEPGGHARGEVHEVLDIGERIRLLLGGQGAPRPVVALAALDQLDAELVADERLQAELGVAEQAGGDRGVEDGREVDAEVAAHGGDVVVAGVEDLEHRRVGEDRRQRRQIAKGQRIDEPGAALVGAQLDQADLLRVVVEAVALDIDADRAAPRELVDEVPELVGGTDPRIGLRRHGAP